MEKELGITEARKQFASLVEHVKYQGDSYVIVRRGKPAAALVPINIYDRWRKEREQLFEVISKIQEANPQVDPDQVMKDVLEAQQAIRSSLIG